MQHVKTKFLLGMGSGREGRGRLMHDYRNKIWMLPIPSVLISIKILATICSRLLLYSSPHYYGENRKKVYINRPLDHMHYIVLWLHIIFIFPKQGILNHSAVFPYIYLHPVLWPVSIVLSTVTCCFNKANTFLTNYPEYNQRKNYLTILTEMLASGIQESTEMFPWHA